MKRSIVLLFLFVGYMGIGQKYFTKAATLDFEASVPAFEPVKAKSETATAILDTENGNLAVLALIKGFRFKNALMEEHFNENYMDSDTYPKATFKGKVEGFDANHQGEKEYTVSGSLEIHGKTKDITAPLVLSKKDNNWVGTTKFTVAPKDFDIEIPNLVKEKISDSINITAYLDLQKRN